MAERITNADLDRIAATVSEGLHPGLHIAPQRRNGYVGLDLYRGSAQLETLHIGTAREVYTYLQGMRRAHLLRLDVYREYPERVTTAQAREALTAIRNRKGS